MAPRLALARLVICRTETASKPSRAKRSAAATRRRSGTGCRWFIRMYEYGLRCVMSSLAAGGGGGAGRGGRGDYYRVGGAGGAPQNPILALYDDEDRWGGPSADRS